MTHIGLKFFMKKHPSYYYLLFQKDNLSIGTVIAVENVGGFKTLANTENISTHCGTVCIKKNLPLWAACVENLSIEKMVVRGKKN